MDLKSLRHFLALCNEGTLTGAARSLGLSQPALSRQIQLLEQSLGCRLFIRHSHSIELTVEGRYLRSKAQDIVELANRLEQEFSSSGQTVSGEISIGAGETVAMRGIAQIIRQIQMQWPAIRCHIFSGNAEDVIGRLDSGLLDFGVLIQPVNIDKYDFITLPDRDIWGVIMRKDSPFAACEQITREELMQMPLICSRQVMLRIRQEYSFNDWFRGIREQLNIVATYNLIYNAAVMVDEGVGYALTLDQLVNVTNHRHLCFRPLSPRLESGLNIVWKKNRVFAPAAQLFLEALRENYPNGIPGKKEK